MRTSLLGVLLLEMAVLTVSAGCTDRASRPNPNVDGVRGDVGLAIQIGDGVRVDAVNYVIDGNGFNKTGTIDVSNSVTISAVIGGIPAGAGYTITLTAISVDGTANCLGTATFDVAPSATTAVAVPLRCTTGPRNGSVLVNGVLNVCPIIDALTSIPAETAVGGTLMLSASVRDLDNAPSPLAYTWSSTTGSVASGSSHAAFTCTTAGVATVTLSVSDGDCGDTMSMDVRCTLAPEGGMGGASGSGGSGGVGGASGSGGVAGAGGSGGASGAGGSGGASGSDGGGVNLGPVETVLNSKSPACLACASSNCVPEMVTCAALPGAASEGPAVGETRLSLCVQTLSCAITSNCAATNPSTCYCGSASGEACLGQDGGTPNGVCRTSLERSLETTDPLSIAGRFGADTLGGGAAMLLMSCLANAPCASCFGGDGGI